jgi:hypothetical protein
VRLIVGMKFSADVLANGKIGEALGTIERTVLALSAVARAHVPSANCSRGMRLSLAALEFSAVRVCAIQARPRLQHATVTASRRR